MKLCQRGCNWRLTTFNKVDDSYPLNRRRGEVRWLGVILPCVRKCLIRLCDRRAFSRWVGLKETHWTKETPFRGFFAPRYWILYKANTNLLRHGERVKLKVALSCRTEYRVRKREQDGPQCAEKQPTAFVAALGVCFVAFGPVNFVFSCFFRIFCIGLDFSFTPSVCTVVSSLSCNNLSCVFGSISELSMMIIKTIYSKYTIGDRSLHTRTLLHTLDTKIPSPRT